MVASYQCAYMPRVRDVNSTGLATALELGCRTMESAFDESDDYRTFFTASVRPRVQLAFHPEFSDAHIPGRHLNALLSAEAEAGISVDPAAVAQHAKNLFFSLSGSVPLPLNRPRQHLSPSVFRAHNIREGLHGLHALIRYRGCERARAAAERALDTILEKWDPTNGWAIRRSGDFSWENFTVAGVGRAIGPLAKLYCATGDGRALELAQNVKNQLLDGDFPEDGSWRPERLGYHVHSVTSSLSSLAQLAELTDDRNLLDRVRMFYDNGLWRVRDVIGWALELDLPAANPDRGEGNTSGDIVETALILARAGDTRYYEDAERIVRCHLLPSQLVDVSFAESPGEAPGTGASRLRGAFGFPAPYGHEPLGASSVDFNLDIVGGVVGSLVAVFQESTSFDGNCHCINMHFDHDTDAISVRSPYPSGVLSATLKHPGRLRIRVPSWAPSPTIETHPQESFIREADWLILNTPPVGEQIAVNFGLAEREVVLEHRTRSIRARVVGDRVTKMESLQADLTFFDDYTS